MRTASIQNPKPDGRRIGFPGVRLACGLVALMVLAGCQTAMTPGSLYRMTGDYGDLVAEPTFDLGSGPPEGSFYSFRVPHKDADGHSYFDVPIVVCEQILFAPTWVFSGLLSLSGSEPYMWVPRPTGPGIPLESSIPWMARETLGWVIAVPGMASYFAGIGATMVFDTVIHDIPVIVVGIPLRIIEQLDLGSLPWPLLTYLL